MPLYQINLKIDPRYANLVDRASLRAAARAALKHQQAPLPGALTILVADAAVLHQLNARFLGEDHPTDVLSFPAGEAAPDAGAPASGASDEGARYFGDIALSLPTARKQARAAGHPLRAELQLLVVHGVLHLLGHDHARKPEQARMWQAQAEILAALV